jgi:potassium/chloride transporter 4/5/6
MSAESNTSEPSGLGLGTFLGVFTPTTLTILGVIMYLRVGWVVGNAGLLGTLLIVLIANSITFISTLSLSALSTNMRVGVGGAYYLISRSMGLEIGGALGIPLYLSQTLSLTLYAFGLAESMRIIWPGAPVQFLAGVIVIAVVLIAARSTVLALKMQLPIMAFIALSLLSLVLGVDFDGSKVESLGPWTDAGFWGVFAVFFPAVTGILAGLGLSGDLSDPSKSIPRGSVAAVLVGFAVYLLVPITLANGASAEVLRADPLIWTQLAWVGLLVLPGLWGAIFSSAIGSILTAPRTLQALAQDGLVPSWMGRVSDNGEPMLALRLSGLVALAAVALGDLNVVAGVVTMFFLTTYGMLNLASALEDLVKDPSYRPRIRTPWWISLLGAFGCFVAMAAINPLAFVVAVIVELVIWYAISRMAIRAAWGDLRSGLWFAMARFAMLRLRTSRQDPRNWRPHLLVFTADLARNLPMIRMAARFSQDHGIVTVNTMKVGDLENHDDVSELLEQNRALLSSAGVLAFCEVTAVPSLISGIVTITQSHGFAGLESNVVMLGFPHTTGGVQRLFGLVRRLDRLEKCTIVVKPGTTPPVPDPNERAPEILVWWKGREHNGDLMLLLAHLLSVSDGWQRAHIVLCSIVESDEEGEELAQTHAQMLSDTRIHARVDIIQCGPDESPQALIRRKSATAALVFFGMAIVEEDQEEEAAIRMEKMLEGMPTALVVRNSGPFRGRLV